MTTEGGRLRWAQRASYAPTAHINVPEAPEGCSLHLLYTLPPSAFFDPFTARLAPPVRDVHVLGAVDLEHMPGWASESRMASQIENVSRAWWEGEARSSYRSCTGAQCEHTALLLDLAHGGEVDVPLHMRYARATRSHAPQDTTAQPLINVTQRLSTDHALGAWLHRTLSAWHRGLSPWFTERTVPQALLADVPVVIAVCPAAMPIDWDAIDMTDPLSLLPPTHAQWHPQLRALFNEQFVYVPLVPMDVPSETSALIPIGDTALAAPVILTTIAAVWLATLWLSRCVWRAI